MKNSVFIEIVSALLILLFIYAAISKIIDHQTFLVQLGRSPLLTRFAPLLVWTVPIIEILLAILLAIRFTRMLALQGAFFLMILFTVYLIAMLNLSYYIPCSCGGILGNLSWQSHIIFNLIDRKSTRLNQSLMRISYAVFCWKKKTQQV